MSGCDIKIVTIETKIKQISKELSDREWENKDTKGLEKFLNSLYKMKAQGESYYIPF